MFVPLLMHVIYSCPKTIVPSHKLSECFSFITMYNSGISSIEEHLSSPKLISSRKAHEFVSAECKML